MVIVLSLAVICYIAISNQQLAWANSHPCTDKIDGEKEDAYNPLKETFSLLKRGESNG